MQVHQHVRHGILGTVLTSASNIVAAQAQDRVPLAVPDLRGNELAYLQQCIVDNWVSSAGPAVTALEAHVAALCNRRYGIATVNGTAALHLALKIAGIGAGQRVAVPDFTFAATTNAVLAAGATPHFFDVTPQTWTIDPDLLDHTLRRTPVTVSAVIAVHVLGQPADMDPIRAICADHSIPLVEDAAGAIGATYRGRPTGSLSDAGCFSFNGNKTVTAGGGGMIVTDDPAWAARARALSTQSRVGAAYRYREAGFNYRMPNVNAALGLAQFERMHEMVDAKRRIAARYDQAIAGRQDLVPMPRVNWAESSCWLYSVRCADGDNAADLVRHMDRAGIEARVFWEALSAQEPYWTFDRTLTGVAALLSGAVVSLPSSSSLSAGQHGRVLGALSRWSGDECSALGANP